MAEEVNAVAEDVKNILMRRDNMSADEADALIERTKAELDEAIENIDICQAEDIIRRNLGLDPDYMEELIRW